MDFELQTICVVRPAYFTITVLLLLATAIASGISIIIAITRRISGRRRVSRHLRSFHVGVVVVWATFAVVMGVGWIRDQRVLQKYEASIGRAAPTVRAAMHRETRTLAIYGAACVVVGLLSMFAWRGMARRAPGDHVL